MNLIPLVAKELGLGIGQEFKIETEGELRFSLTLDGVKMRSPDIDKVLTAPDYIFRDIVTGQAVIIKIPFVPEEGQIYYYVQWVKGLLSVEPAEYHAGDSFHDKQMYCKNIFFSKDEAEEAKYDVYQRITGKEWNDFFENEGDGL